MNYESIYPTFNGILYKRNGKIYCHGCNNYGEFGLGYNSPSYIDKSNPVEAPWSADEIITSGGYHIFFRKGNDWYACGANWCGELGLGDIGKKIHIPVKIPLNITKIIANISQTFFCTDGGEWYACGSNDYGQLFVNSKEKYIHTPMKTSIRPKKIMTDDYESIILMDDDKLYEYGYGCYDYVNELMLVTDEKKKKYLLKLLERNKNKLCQMCKFDHVCDESYSTESMNNYSTASKTLTIVDGKIKPIVTDEENEDNDENDDDDNDDNDGNCSYCIDCLFNKNLLSDRGKKEYQQKRLMKQDAQLMDLQKLLVDKYEPLKKYFQNLTMLDLTEFTMQDILNNVSMEDRLLAKLFCRTYLSKVLYDPGFKYSDDVFTLDVDTDGKINLKDRVTGNRVQKKSITISDLHNSIKDDPRIRILSLRKCRCLCSRDLPDIHKLVKSLPKLEVVDMFGTGITYVNAPNTGGWIKAILDMEQIVYFNIADTGFTFIDNKDFFNSLNNNQLDKLIWINKKWLHKGGWTSFFTNPILVDRIIRVHEKYYKIYK